TAPAMSDDESFAALFEAQCQGEPRQRPQRPVRVGETVEGLVAHVGADTIFVELDGKRPAMLDAIEMRNQDGSIDVKVGDTLRAKVISVDASTGDVRLGRS